MARIMDAFETYFKNVVLPTHNNPDFFRRWLDNIRTLETQLLVSPEGGYPVADKHNVWTDGTETWHHIRWPANANNEPSWRDRELGFLLENHWLGVGTTWWDWTARESVGVGFDFDEITSHAPGTGITDEQLEEVKNKACKLDYVEVIRSTGGKGLHLYVWFAPDSRPRTRNHNEHAALARSMLGKLSTDAGFDFGSHLDVCGSVLWTAHRKMTVSNHGFQSIKKATNLLTADHVPPNWRDHLDVIGGKTTKVRVVGVNEDGREINDQDPLTDLTSAHTKTPLDDVHKAIINDLELTGGTCVWVPDHHLLQTHTACIKQVHTKWAESGHPMRGFFDTSSKGANLTKPNCFCIPGPDGSFSVFRFGKGTCEHALWTQDSEGWTWTNLNKSPTLSEAAVAVGGVEEEGCKGFYFDETVNAVAAVKAIGSEITLPEGNKYAGRPTTLRRNKDGRLVVELEKYNGDTGFESWIEKKNKWVKLYNINVDVGQQDEDYTRFDSITRSIRTPAATDAGWMLRVQNGDWVKHPQDNVKHVLKAVAPPNIDISTAMGHAVMRQWMLVNLPFHEEYPGGRQWNLGAAQLVYKPAKLDHGEKPYHPNWDMILTHCGADLDRVIQKLDWCKRWNIFCGKDYLTAWIACLFRAPFEPLPYLFMYGPQLSGKSTFHEAVSTLVTGGVVKADRALTNQNDFNGELANAVLGVVDEVDVSRAGPTVYNKIKEWTTSRIISIHPKRMQVYQQRNCLHFVQMSNYRDSCPIFPGDTRITMMHVPPFIEEIPKLVLFKSLEDEAPHFMATLMGRELPTSHSRLRLPIVSTDEKAQAAESNQDPLQTFIAESCYEVPGEKVLFSDFFDRFKASLSAFESTEWPKRRVRQGLPVNLPMGKSTGGQIYIGNLSFKPKIVPPDTPKYVLAGRYLNLG